MKEKVQCGREGPQVAEMKAEEDDGKEEWGGLGKTRVVRLVQCAVEGAGAWFLTALLGRLVPVSHVCSHS